MCRILLTFSLLFLCVVFVRAQTYVSPSGTGGGGSLAYASSRADGSGNVSNGGELWLLGGVYEITETLEIGQSNISLYGGFEGTETTLDQRDYEHNETILDGGGTTQIMEIAARGVEVDGLIFREGFAANQAAGGSAGGAIYISGNDIAIPNSILRNNLSGNHIGAGAIYRRSCDNIQITDCLFENNRVVANVRADGNIGGGAIHIRFGN